MSLVNDMLRDLDARRRDAPTRGVGTEKLVPASERGRAAASSGLSTGTRLGLLVVVLVLIALVYLLVRPALTTTPTPMTPAPAAISAPAVPTAEFAATPVVTESATGLATEPAAESASAAELQMLAARLQQLEAQNHQLLVQAQSNAQAAATPLTNDPTAAAPADPGLTTSSPIVSSPAAINPAGDQTGVLRSPRELSFQERDRLTVQRALEQWSSGQQLGALQTLDAFAYENPEAHQTRETLAKLLIQQGESERALQAIDIGLRLAPGHAGYRKVKARLLLADNAAQEAVTLLSGTGPAVTADTEYHDLLATAQLGAELYEQAVLSYQALLSQNGTEGRWWYGLATAFDARNMRQDAASAYERALAQSNLNPALRQASQQRVQEIRQGNYGS